MNPRGDSYDSIDGSPTSDNDVDVDADRPEPETAELHHSPFEFHTTINRDDLVQQSERSLVGMSPASSESSWDERLVDGSGRDRCTDPWLRERRTLSPLGGPLLGAGGAQLAEIDAAIRVGYYAKMPLAVVPGMSLLRGGGLALFGALEAARLTLYWAIETNSLMEQKSSPSGPDAAAAVWGGLIAAVSDEGEYWEGYAEQVGALLASAPVIQAKF